MCTDMCMQMHECVHSTGRGTRIGVFMHVKTKCRQTGKKKRSIAPRSMRTDMCIDICIGACTDVRMHPWLLVRRGLCLDVYIDSGWATTGLCPERVDADRMRRTLMILIIAY